MHLLVCCCSLLIFLNIKTSAENLGKVAGVVRDAASREPIFGANVIIKGTKMGASTDAAGAYFILRVPPGVYEVSASIIGYGPVTQRTVIVNADRTTTVDFGLHQKEVVGEEVIITAARPDVEKEKTSTSQIIRSDDVAAVAGITNLSDVLTLVADIDEGHFRGGREGEELYTLNGVSLVNPLNSTLAFAPLMSAIEEVEIITSGFSAQYGNAQSGVVNISMKEGGRDQWRSRAEVRSRLPAYKHFGPTPFDLKSQKYLQLLSSDSLWMASDPNSQNASRYFSSLGYNFDSRYDSVTASKIAYALWNQARRDVNRKYDNLVDYAVEASAGGPITDDVRLFLAGRVDNAWPFIPTPNPETKRQLMGNLVFDLSSSATLRLSGSVADEFDYLLPTGANSFFRWVFDRIAGLSEARTASNTIGIRFAHTLTVRTFYEIRLSRLETRYKDGFPIIDPSRYGSDDRGKISVWPSLTLPDNFNNGMPDNDIRNEKTVTTSLNASLTSQVSQSHMLLAGIQANLFSIAVNNRTNMSTSGTELDEIYAAKPYEFALYAQDKMEFKGMIANVGLRVDAWNANTQYYKDAFSPFRKYVNDSVFVIDPRLADKEHTALHASLQPRVGISFPVYDNTVFHLNYGLFVQRPPFERTVYERYPVSNYNNMRLGNPQLKAEATNSYDVGIMQGLGAGFTLDISGYYKDVSNLIQTAMFFDSTGNQYSTYVNRDYADIRGFQVALTNRIGKVTGSLNYNYSVAKGKSATPFDASPKYYERPQGGQPAEVLPDPDDILMDFDRTHSLIAKLVMEAPDEIKFSLSMTWRSGRPYTYNDQGLRLINNKRSPAEYNTNLRISKDFSRFIGTNATVYMEVINLVNQRTLSYNSVFQRVSSSGSLNENPNLKYYESGDPEQLIYYRDNPPFEVDREFMLFSNSPRSINLGIIISM